MMKNTDPQKLITAKINSYYDKKKKDRKWFSKRAMARALELSPSFLSEILSGKKLLPAKHLDRVIQVLDIDFAAAMEIKKAYLKIGQMGWMGIDFVGGETSASSHKLNLWKMAATIQKEMLRNWHFLPMMEITTLENFNGDFEKRLGISSAMASQGLVRLQELGLIKNENGRWIKTDLKLQFVSSTSQDDFRAFHRSMNRKAMEELEKSDNQSFAKRLITGSTVAIPSARVEEFKLRINDFMKDFLSECSEGPCDEIYSFNIKFFPLSK